MVLLKNCKTQIFLSDTVLIPDFIVIDKIGFINCNHIFSWFSLKKKMLETENITIQNNEDQQEQCEESDTNSYSSNQNEIDDKQFVEVNSNGQVLNNSQENQSSITSVEQPHLQQIQVMNVYNK